MQGTPSSVRKFRPYSSGFSRKQMLILALVFGVVASILILAVRAAPGDPDGIWYNISPSNISANPNNPFDNYGFNSIVIHPTTPSTLYMGTNYQGLWRSTNSGVSWTKINTGTGGSLLDQGRNWALAIDPHNPSIIWTTSGYGAGGPLKSTDGGVSWVKLPAGSPTRGDDVYSIAIDPYTPNHILLQWHYTWNGDIAAGVSESFNGGQSWTNHAAPSGSNWGAGNMVAFMDNGQTWLVGSQGGGVWRTTNSGTNWTQVSTSNITHGATFALTKYGGSYYMALENGVLTSSNGGQTWTNISAGLPSTYYSNVASDGTYLYTTQSFPNLAGFGSSLQWYRRPISSGSWTAMTNSPNVCNNYGGGSVCNGPVSSAYDATNKIAYTVNWNGGVWKLRASGSGGSTCPAGTTGTPPNCTPTSTKFQTLPVNATLPSDADCTARVRPTAEIRPGNTVYNFDVPVGTNYEFPRVTGSYHGTTDEIIQWAACKWGLDEDVLRAQAVQESYWRANAAGDWTTDGTACSPLWPIKNYGPQYQGDISRTGQCPESYGLLQIRWTYHKSAFYSSQTENASTLTNNAIYSTSYNADYYGAIWRSCYNGEMDWLNTVERGTTYAAGDMWGCLGVWFSGRWRTQPALDYITSVQNNLNSRTWEQSFFINFSSGGETFIRQGSTGRTLDLRDFEAEEMYFTTPVVAGSDPNASNGSYIQF